MAGTDVPSAATAEKAAIHARSARVGADILARFRQLAMNLRQSGWDEVAAMGAAPDPAERASRLSAFQLYGAAASELEDIIAELLDGADHARPGTMPPANLRVLAGGKPDGPSRNGRRR